MPPIYLDHAATTPCDPAVIEAMRPFWSERFGNALSPHAFGRRARCAIEEAREELASLLGAHPSEIVFTSGATEANNHVISGVARSLKDKGGHLVVSAIEHHSILEPAKRLLEEGYTISYVAPDQDGTISVGAVEAALQPDTILIAVGHANNEIGVIQPIADIGRLARARGVYLLVDMAQTAGHIPAHVGDLHCDFSSLSAHKFYGPQGAGALYMRKGVLCGSLLLGGDQERSRRASTQNTAGIAGLGKAAALCRQAMAQEMKTQQTLRDALIGAVLKEIPRAVLNGHRIRRLPNNAHFSFENTDGEGLVAALDIAGIACSAGSACTSGQLAPSHVLKAIGSSDRMALGSLRITLGRWTTEAEIQYFIEQLKIKTQFPLPLRRG
ncbi:MAG: cysteine desulfurase [Candidatus Omnitrophica bacterium]|nr:cysteine desulfurase [Candidatus Omnitrophota bacterium]